MLNDRDYMRRGGGPINLGRQLRESALNARKCVWIIVAINVLMYILYVSSPNLNQWMNANMVLSSLGLKSGKVWTLVTAMFMHSDQTIAHILFNMYGLVLFGMLVAPVLGTKRFLTLYFVSGIAGNVAFVIFNWNSPFGLLGASGALFGVMLAAAMLMPHLRFMLFFPPIPMKVTTLVVVYAAVEIFSQVTGTGGNVAHLAHLGGFAGGYLALKVMIGPRLAWDPLRFLKLGGVSGPHFYQPPPADDDDPRSYRRTPDDAVDDGSPVSSREIDGLLDKISRHGINALSPREQARLRRAREEMRKR